MAVVTEKGQSTRTGGLLRRLWAMLRRWFGPPERDAPADTRYEANEDALWAEAVVAFEQQRSADGSLVTLVGTCLHCKHDMSVVLAVRARTGARVGEKPLNESLGRNGKRRFVKIAYCNCEGVHGERPEAVSGGCGRFGALLVGEQTNESPPPPGRFVSVRRSSRRAAISDLTWERRAEDQSTDRLTSARTSAEKWTAAVATLTGVFSVALVVKGPEDVTKVTGEVAWRTGLSGTLAAVFAGVGIAVLVATFALRHKVPRAPEWP
jgi:hypothetical protein